MSERISVIVPVYNEGSTVALVVERLLTIELPVARELIIVNDGSRDLTRDVLDAMPKHDDVVLIHMDVNRGKGHAVRQGIARARGTIIAIQDADLELDPIQLVDLVSPLLRHETDVVYGSRFLDGGGRRPRSGYLANQLLTGLTNLLYGSALTDMETCYKVARTEVLRSLELSASRFDIEPEITAQLLRRGYQIVERPVRYTPRSRSAGKTIGVKDGLAAIATLLRCRLRA